MTTKVEPFYVALGLKVQAVRKRRKMKQQELGGTISPPLTRAAIANIEGGKQRVRVHTLWEIARVLGVSPMELVPTAKEESERLSRQRAVEADLAKWIPELPKERLQQLSKKAINSLATRERKRGRLGA